MMPLQLFSRSLELDSLLNSHGGGFSSAIVSQKRGDLSLVEAECQSVHGKLLSMAINLDQVLDIDSKRQVIGLLLNAHSWKKQEV